MSLHVEEITSIGAVDSGDNPGSFVAFWKRKKKGNAESVETNTRDEMDTFDVTGLPDEAQEHIAELAKSAETAAETIEALEAQVAELTPTPVVDEVDIGKASDEVQTLIAKLREDNDGMAETIAVEVTKRRDTEFIAKLRKDDLEGLLGDAEEVGPVLRELDDAAPDAFGKIYPALVAAGQRTGEFFKEIGASEGDADPTAQRDAWVSKQKQDGSERTVADLRTDFWKAHPDAVAAERENK